MAVPFVLPSVYKDTITFDDLGIEMGLEFVAQYLGFGGYSYDYTLPPGGLPDNSLSSYNLITWLDARVQPTYSFLTTTAFAAFNNIYRNQLLTFGKKQDQYWAVDKPRLDAKADLSAMTSALALKADSAAMVTSLAAKADASAMTSALAGKAAVSHTHAQADVTNLTSDLANRVLANANYRLHKAKGNSDANGELLIHLTDDGLSTGNALFSTSDVPIIEAMGWDGSGTPIQSPNVFGKAWSNGNKSVTVKVNKGTSTGVLIGGTVVSDAYSGAGYTIEVMAFGPKA